MGSFPPRGMLTEICNPLINGECKHRTGMVLEISSSTNHLLATLSLNLYRDMETTGIKAHTTKAEDGKTQQISHTEDKWTKVPTKAGLSQLPTLHTELHNILHSSNAP